MEFIKEWSFCICITLIIAVIFSILTPKGKLSSFYKTIISIFIFLSFVYPFANSNLNIPFDDFEIKKNDNEMKLCQSVVESQIKDLLLNNSIEGACVTTCVEEQDNQINITDVQIAVPDDYDTNDVEKIVYDNLSISAEVIHNGE